MNAAPVLPPPPPPPSKAAVAGGVGGAGIAIYVIDRLLANDGLIAANVLTKLSPLVGPLWASWPLLVLVVVLAWVARDKWALAQHARRIEVAAQTASAAELAGQVGGVVDGLTGLRAEVHSLRGDLRAHADQTDARFRATDETFRGQISAVTARVEHLERRGRRRPAEAGPG